MSTHKPPSRTIQAQCHICVGSRSAAEVKNCTGHIVFATGKPCAFYQYRTGGKRPFIKIMRQFCLDCMGGSREAVRECSTADCLIHPYRFGKNPALAGKRTPAGIEALRKYRQTHLEQGKSGLF